jgi:hypothetical protein
VELTTISFWQLGEDSTFCSADFPFLMSVTEHSCGPEPQAVSPSPLNLRYNPAHPLARPTATT